MKYVPYKLSRMRLLVLSIFTAFVLPIFQPATKTIADSDKQPVVATGEATVKANPERIALQPTASLVTFRRSEFLAGKASDKVRPRS